MRAMRSNAYWIGRAKNRMKEYHRQGDKTIQIVAAAYEKAIADIDEDIRKIYDKFKFDSGLTDKEIRKLLNSKADKKVLEELRKEILLIEDPDIRNEVMAKLNAPAYRARITRLEALKLNIYVEVKKVADIELQASKSLYINTINNAYYKSLFDIQKGIGLGFNVAAMPTHVIQEILKNPWSGKHFSERIWGNTDLIAEQLTKIMTSGFMSGRSISDMSREIRTFTSTTQYVANRLIRTELTYVTNAAEKESYKEIGLEEYMYMATLDDRTSDICQELDNKVFKVSEAKPGKNLPPMHPQCRSTTRAWFGEKTLEGIQRRARDPKTGKTYLVPASMNYKQWYDTYVKEG